MYLVRGRGRGRGRYVEESGGRGGAPLELLGDRGGTRRLVRVRVRVRVRAQP